jgi:hypothetical protein
LVVAIRAPKTVRHSDIPRWLAFPDDAPYKIDFYQRRLFDTNTCTRTLEDEKYTNRIVSSPKSQAAFLWIDAIPGAGKTALAV